MRLLHREAWSYGILLVILFSIAAIAVWESISYIQDVIAPDHMRPVTTLVWVLTLGFMLIAGAFGLWATQLASVQAGRRRIGRFVDAMNYLRDGLVALDRRGRVTGFNPSAAVLMQSGARRGAPLAEAFPCLTADDVAAVLRTAEPHEIEHDHATDGISRVLRFRSQPAEGLILLMISDVTVVKAQRARSRQAARLQLIGQMARGVAHDFNRLLCGISGHAGLLQRLAGQDAETRDSCTAITDAAARGIELAAHLLELAQPVTTSPSTTSLAADHILAAADTLRDGLSDAWQVDVTLRDPMPPIGMTGLQVEQVILNLGFLAAEDAPALGHLRIVAGVPRADGALGASAAYAGMIAVGAADDTTDDFPDLRPAPADNVETGVIVSVLASLLEEAYGELQVMTTSGGRRVYRVHLPYARALDTGNGGPDILSEEINVYLRDWTVLLAASGGRYRAFEDRLIGLGVHTERVESLAAALARIEDPRRLDAIVLQAGLLRNVASGLLRAVLKLRPPAAVAVVTEQPGAAEWRALASQVSVVSEHAAAGRMVLALIEAKGHAIRRARAGGGASATPVPPHPA
jgi:signal transduction histidine kinase